MIKLPKYGANVRRYADVSFAQAWRYIESRTRDDFAKDLEWGNFDHVVWFSVHMQYSPTLMGASAQVISADDRADRIAELRCLWEREYQQREWHVRFFRWHCEEVMRRRGDGTRPLIFATDEQLEEAAAHLLTADPELDGVEACVHQSVLAEIAQREQSRRESESAHERMEAIARQSEMST